MAGGFGCCLELQKMLIIKILRLIEKYITITFYLIFVGNSFINFVN
jgi:hypothetical protein